MEQGSDGENLFLIDALRQVIGLRNAVGREAGLIDFYGLPHPFRSDNAAGIRLTLLFVSDGGQPSQIDFASGLVYIIAVTIGGRQIGQQSGEKQGQHQQNPGKS